MGSTDRIGAHFASTVIETKVLNTIDDLATQLVLNSSCADVTKVVYLPRPNGNKLEHAELENLGGIQHASVAHTLPADIA